MQEKSSLSVTEPASPLDRRELIIGVTPAERPDPWLATAVSAAGGLGVLDLSGGWGAGDALGALRQWAPGQFGIRLARPGRVDLALANQADLVILGSEWLGDPGAAVPSQRFLFEVTSLDEARQALAVGASGLIARGSEAGGRVGELSSFTLLQQLLSDPAAAQVPVWACGGIGPHTAAAGVAGGAAGVVLDTALALLAESELDQEARRAIAAMDGSEPVLAGGYRVAVTPHRPGLDLAGLSPAQVLSQLGRKPSAPGEPTLLPVGQDAFLASRFARDYHDTATAVRAVRAAIRASAAGRDPVFTDPDVLGTPLAVAQGPMTRVSDEPAFAAAVAADGGLPFIALALADADRSRDLLTRTRDLLGGRPWGAGILGFVPEELRAAQLEVIMEVRPSHVIIAGGRPAHASALEQAGISTFLHVPSPVLLDQFLRSGARKFVFEGAECGGHVGPRNSFPLWEAQIGVILDQLDAPGGPAASDVSVLFAGGIHDARSSAMVAALAAPLTSRGVRTGILMGTAYLFTEEAVASAAIHEVFQRQVIAADRTCLLETAPGHATRCVASPFTREFGRLRDEWRAAGVPDRQVWADLEALNVGRLRIASKGVQRRGDTLVASSEEGQLTDGLFMSGQAAVLRSSRTTVADLHHAVTSGAGQYRQERSTDLAAAAAAPPGTIQGDRDIAIVGMACVFPDAPDLAAYWRNVVSGHDAITEVPADRWDPEIYFDPDAADGTASVSKWGGFLPRVPFDALRFGLPPATLPSVEPVQLLALEVARRALQDAFGDRPFPAERTSVVFGAEAGSDLASATVLRATLPAYYGKVPAAIDPALPRLTPDSFPGMLANVIAGRIANRLDLGGSNFIVDAACASSLAAVDIARKELLYGTSDVVLCGGADLHNGVGDYMLFSSVQALSRSGRSRPFDQHADGIALGEGVACLVLRRLADARRDGDRVYAVIKGIGSASDGKSLGLTAPRKEGQRAALARAYSDAQVSPSLVALVEAHGTGTVVGDRTELLALTEEFAAAGTRPREVILGSVKSQIGHTKCAAGLAGMIKTALAVHAGVLPPTGNLEQPNPAWDSATSPFSFITSGRPWPAGPGERYAGVSAFGFGGTNFHVVLGADDVAAPPQTGLHCWPAELFVFAGRDLQAARSQAAALADLVTANERAGRPWPMRVLAADAAERAAASRQPVQISLVARDLAELGALLRQASTGQGEPQRGLYLARDFEALRDRGARPAVAFLFPGQGSQFTGMFAQLLTAFPRLQRHLARPLADTIYPPTAFDDETAAAQAKALIDTRAAQPALGFAALVARDLLGLVGLRPDMAGGHSYGELAALCVSGALADADLLRLSAARAGAIAEATRDVQGAMAAIGAGEDEVRESLTASGLLGPVVIANVNAPTQTVISGEAAAVQQALAALRAAGHAGRLIPVACAFHSPLVASAGAAFAETLAATDVGRPGFPVFANRIAHPYPDDPTAIRRELAEAIAAPVRFADEIEAMYAAGARVFVEAGPGRTLARLAGAVLGDRPHLAVPLQPSDSAGIKDYLDALARIAVCGVPLDFGALFRGRVAPPRPGEEVPAQARWLVDGQLVRGADGQPLPGGLRPAQRIEEPSVTNAHDNYDSQRPDPAREQLVADFLRSSREMLAAQRDVLLSYLGPAAPPPAAVVPPARGPLPAAAPAEIPRAPANGHAVTAVPAGPAVPAGASGPVADIAGVVRSVISERTGYPPEMIEPDLDLEADLSIDSIKRMEISATLITRLAPGAVLDDGEVEDLSRARTAAGISGWLSAHLAPEPDDAPLSGPVPDAAGPAERVGRGERPSRYQWQPADLAEPADPKENAAQLAGKRVLILGADPALAGELSAQLAGLQATTDVAGAAWDGGDYAGVIWVPATGAGKEPVLPEGFALIQSILTAGVGFLVTAVPVPAGGRDLSLLGLRGLFRTAAREFPGVNVKLVETDTLADPAAAARVLLAELTALDHQPVIFREGGARRVPSTVRADLSGMAATGAGPVDDGVAEARALGLGPDSVILVIGGARGITARTAVAFAAAARCRLVLAGRTEQPAGPESADTAAARTLGELRAVFVARGNTPIREAEKEVRRILAQRELGETIADASRYGSEVSYQTINVLNTEAVSSLVKDVYQQYGRLDGVIYGAGVTVDQLVAKTTMESFRLVYETKVAGAAALLAALADLPAVPRFAVLFGSVATVIGSRGQVGYAAANDALETLARQWAEQTGARGVTVHWGPWAPVGSHAGMVSPELERDFSRRGLALIDPDEGPMCLLRELAWGGVSGAAPTTAIYAPSGWLES